MSAVTDRVDVIMAQWQRERPDLDASPMGVIGRLHRLADILDARLASVFDEFELTRGEFDVLAALRRSGAPYELLASALAESTMITAGGLTKRVDRLCERGLLERAADTTDGRVRRIRLTPAGLSLVNAAVAAHTANEHALIRALGAGAPALAQQLKEWTHALESEQN